MMRKNSNIKLLCLLGAVLALTSCLPKEGERIYPYNYNPDDEYYLTEDEAELAPDMGEFADPDYLLAPAGGMVFTPLFSKKISDEDDRFDRLEDAVQVLRNDVDVLIPRMFQVSEQQFNAEKKAAEAPKPAAPEMPISLNPVAEATKAEAPKPAIVAPAAKLASVYHVRVADHKENTRLVLDLNSNLQLKTSISADGKQLVVDAANLKWLPGAVWNALSGQLVSGYRYQNGTLTVDLMYPSKITKQSLLLPNKDSGYYRFVIDLASDRVHGKK